MESVEWRYPLSDLVMGEEEELSIVNVIRSKWLSMGPTVARLEEEWVKFYKVKYALATSNCTCALHLALLSLGIKAGDEVIVPSLSFVATANSVLYCGAVPVFADIESLARPVIDPKSIKQLITPKTKAIMVMHYGGFPCSMGEIADIASRNNLKIIEDSAHASSSRIGERLCGTLSDVGCYSLFANKNLPAGEGGVLVTNDESIFQHAKLLRSHGMTSPSWDRFKGHASGYDVVEVGYNYRMPELSAAIAIEQLKKLPKHDGARQLLYARYCKNLEKASGLAIPFEAISASISPHLMVAVLAPDLSRESFMNSLKNEGIQTSIHYRPIHLFSNYRKLSTQTVTVLPKTEEFATRAVTLPLHPGLTLLDVDEISAAVLKGLEHAKAKP